MDYLCKCFRGNHALYDSTHTCFWRAAIGEAVAEIRRGLDDIRREVLAYETGAWRVSPAGPDQIHRDDESQSLACY